MPRALITLVFAISLSAMTIWATVDPALGLTRDRHPHFVEAESPPLPAFAMSIL